MVHAGLPLMSLSLGLSPKTGGARNETNLVWDHNSREGSPTRFPKQTVRGRRECAFSFAKICAPHATTYPLDFHTCATSSTHSTTRTGEAMRFEKRQSDRARIDLLLNKYVSGEPYLVRGLNLSRGGMLIQKVIEPELPQTKVLLELELPDCDDLLFIEGMALQAERSSRTMAIRFLRMTPRDARHIDLFLKDRSFEN